VNRIISFCLFGNHPMYLIGAVENSRLFSKIFPGWSCRFYVSDEIPAAVVEELRGNGATVTIRQRQRKYDALFWRFYPAAEKTLDALVVRDVDSRLSEREYLAVEDWLQKGKGLHVIRDHPNHIAPIMAGMWGCRGGVLADIHELIHLWTSLHSGDAYGTMEARNCDQVFLFEMVYRRMRDDVLIHSEFIRFEGEDAQFLPGARKGLEFIGQVFLEDGGTRQDHLDALARGMERGRDGFPLRRFTR
jgi:hypothetical protein